MLKEWQDKWDQCCRNKLYKIIPVVGEKHWDHINYTRRRPLQTNPYVNFTSFQFQLIFLLNKFKVVEKVERNLKVVQL